MEGQAQQRLTWENSAQFGKVCEAVCANHSVLVIGEAGMGVGEMAQALYEQMLGDFQAAIATYKGSVKKFFTAIAFQLDIPTENEDGKQLTVDQLKEEIAVNCSDGTLLILPEAKRLTTSIRYWLEDLMANGVVVGYRQDTCKLRHDVKFCNKYYVYTPSPCIYLRQLN